jgi:hypothetical protein
MRQDGDKMIGEADFEDENQNRCVAKITRLQKLIVLEEQKLFKAMRDARNLKAVPQK